MEEIESGVRLDSLAEAPDEKGVDSQVTARIPDVFGLLRPLLQILADGADWKIPEVSEAVADRINLDAEARSISVPSGRLLFENRIRWTCTNLSKAELVELVGQSTISITDAGRSALRTD